MQVEDLEEKQPSLKRPLTPLINVTSEPPTKRFGSDKVVEGQVEGQSDDIETMDDTAAGQSDDIETMDSTAAENVECADKAGEDNPNSGLGEVDKNVIMTGVDSGSGGIECEQAEHPPEPAVDLSESNDLLLSNIPKIYDLFATCVS